MSKKSPRAQKKKKLRAAKAKRSSPKPPTVDLQPCVQRFLELLAHPFVKPKGPVCLPLGDLIDCIPSRTFVRAVMSTSATTYVGWVALRGTAASDRAMMWHTDSSYVGTGTTAIATTGTGINAPTPTGSFLPASAWTTSDASAKPTLIALRIRNITPQLYRGGRAGFFVDQEDYKVVGMTPDAIYARSNFVPVPTDGRWHSCVFSSSSPKATVFETGDAAEADSYIRLQNTDCSPIGFLAYGGGYTQNYEIEGVYHYSLRYSLYPGLNQPADAQAMGVGAATLTESIPRAIMAPSEGDRVQAILDSVGRVVGHSERALGLGARLLKLGTNVANAAGYGRPMHTRGVGGLNRMAIEDVD